MKRLILFGFAVVLAAAIAAPPAAALSLGAGEFEGKFGDHSNLYSQQDLEVDDGEIISGDLALDPEGLGDTINLGDEQRTISRVTTIEELNSSTVVFDTSSLTELTGMLYDLEVVAITPVVSALATVLVVDFAPSGRNPLIGDVDGDTIGALDPTDSHAIVFGGVFELYEDGTKDFTSDPNGVGSGQTLIGGAGATAGPPLPIAISPLSGPETWVEGAAGHAGAVGADTFINVTDGTYLLSAVLIELQYLANIGAIATPGVPFAAGTVLRETIELGAGVGSGFGFLNIVGGVGEASFGRSGLGFPLIDISMTFDLDFARITDADGSTLGVGFGGVPTLTGNETITDTATYSGQGQWQIDSEDPVLFNGVIPEPATMSLLGIGLIGLAGAGLRKRKK